MSAEILLTGEQVADPVPAEMFSSSRQRRPSGVMRNVSTLLSCVMFRLLNVNWFLGFVGLELVKLEETEEEMTIRKRKNEDLVENEMKRLKSERSPQGKVEEEQRTEMLGIKTNLIQDFKMKLWNLSPIINFSKEAEDEALSTPSMNVITPSESFEADVKSSSNSPIDVIIPSDTVDDEVETILNSPLRVITPSKSFDNILDLSEAETFGEDQSEVEEVINYNAVATYKVNQIEMEINKNPEQILPDSPVKEKSIYPLIEESACPKEIPVASAPSCNLLEEKKEPTDLKDEDVAKKEKNDNYENGVKKEKNDNYENGANKENDNYENGAKNKEKIYNNKDVAKKEKNDNDVGVVKEKNDNAGSNIDMNVLEREKRSGMTTRNSLEREESPGMTTRGSLGKGKVANNKGKKKKNGKKF